MHYGIIIKQTAITKWPPIKVARLLRKKTTKFPIIAPMNPDNPINTAANWLLTNMVFESLASPIILSAKILTIFIPLV